MGQTIHVWYIYDIFTYLYVDFYGVHVGKYTSPMDPMGGTNIHASLRSRRSSEASHPSHMMWPHLGIAQSSTQSFIAFIEPDLVSCVPFWKNQSCVESIDFEIKTSLISQICVLFLMEFYHTEKGWHVRTQVVDFRTQRHGFKYSSFLQPKCWAKYGCATKKVTNTCFLECWTPESEEFVFWEHPTSPTQIIRISGVGSWAPRFSPHGSSPQIATGLKITSHTRSIVPTFTIKINQMFKCR